MVHIDLIGPYSIQAHQFTWDGNTKVKDFSLTCMTFIDPATGWFEIAEVPLYKYKDREKGDIETVDKTSARISRFFNETWLSHYP